MISALIAIAVSALLPASGALAYYRPSDVALLHRPMVDLGYKQTFFDLRDGLIRTFTLDGPKGIIAFPSYHVALSMAVVLAFRGMPAFFWPLLGLNLAAMATTPVEGGHHLIDGLAGAAVAILSLVIAVAWRRRLVPDEPARRVAERSAAPLLN
jgi:membrane-associated phospholipid phosphatase